MSQSDVADSRRRKTFLGHPRGLATLFFTEMWERFSFYGMRALLVLYLVAAPGAEGKPGPGLGFSTGDAAAVYGTYLALVYVSPIIGGWIADRIIGPRRAVLYGGIVIAAGHFSMAIPIDALFWVGLLLIAIGTGLLKPCISTMVGGLYEGDSRSQRDAGFAIFYMGINLGGFLAPLVVSLFSNGLGWHWGFACAGIGMVFGIVQYVLGSGNLTGIGEEAPNPAGREIRIRALVIGVIGLIALAIVIWIYSQLTGGFSITKVSDVLGIIIVLVPVIYFIRLFRAKNITDVERSRVGAFLFLFVGAVAFWMIFEQAGSTMNVFAEDHTDTSVFGWSMPAPFLQSINPAFIIIFSPIFAWLWMRLADRAPSTPVKFALGLFGIGLSFWIMVIPGMSADNGYTVTVWWLVLVYLIQTWSELVLSPVGLSATSRLAPRGMESQLMALWFLATSVGNVIGGQAARALVGFGFGPYFAIMGGVAIVVAIGFTACIPLIKRLMRGLD
ncbi:MAG: peptide MFS transporter [Actinobacteria bacterium]|nr:peptide MFS transporter [Actinomycetota bacterium]